MIIAIDPGPEMSAVVGYRPEYPMGPNSVSIAEISSNQELRSLLGRAGVSQRDHCVIEWIESYGMAVGKDIFETVYWIGRFREAWLYGDTFHRVTRRDVKLHLCNSMRAKDKNIRVALIDRFGGSKRKAVGLKKTPGPLYGIKTHLWSALAVAVTFAETREKKFTQP